jgi:hypothetical protein
MTRECLKYIYYQKESFGVPPKGFVPQTAVVEETQQLDRRDTGPPFHVATMVSALLPNIQ